VLPRRLVEVGSQRHILGCMKRLAGVGLLVAMTLALSAWVGSSGANAGFISSCLS
jgi:hypothetical protein